ncbi:putative Dyp-type peroxidase family protein [Magnetofaba australis IT-1]|uniref:Putative Dyp-type peroxidase family protein n=1 Tax=Magnetofaba australis IT-1 TaxID=1434232 RepID=A0A1Y2K900_9PROT|nr:putative Dyp-type peroxidase family protein [Magnetofaba australis IT-1]
MLARIAKMELPETVVLGLGAGFIQRLGKEIPGLRPFPALTGPAGSIPATGGDVWVWLQGEDRGELVHQSNAIVAQLGHGLTPTAVVDGFQHGDSQDLTGYEDGTENPEGEKAQAAAIVSGAGAGLDGSSFVAVQQWKHDLRLFKSHPQDEQDNMIGRRLADNEEFDEAPESAHVKRTAQESFTPEAFILRRSMPWTDGMDAGLMFVAFGRSFDAYEAILRRMLGLEDGVADALFRFTRPLTGAFYWCPPRKGSGLDLSALGL